MRKFRLGLTSLSGLVFFLAVPSALAGNCGQFGGQNCDPGVVFNSAGVAIADPLQVNVAQPLGGLRSVHIRTAPAVSITRIYSQQGALAGIGDSPSGFTGGCNPTTTQYCRQNVGTPVNAVFNAQPTQQFVASPIIAAPIVSAPVVSPVVTPSVRFGSGYNPAALAPRQYGEDVFTPGIAHIPTSYVDRSPHTAERLLQSGQTRTASNFSFNSAPTTTFAAPVASSHSFSSHSVAAPTSHTGPVDADGGYWEQVSGPTLFGDTLATQVVCRRQAPVVQQEVQVQTQQVLTQVVRPVVAVPTPVPVYCQPTKVNSRYAFGQQSAKVKAPSFNNFNVGRVPFAGQNFGSSFGQVPFGGAAQFAGSALQIPGQATQFAGQATQLAGAALQSPFGAWTR